jgi:hypothetical protein
LARTAERFYDPVTTVAQQPMHGEGSMPNMSLKASEISDPLVLVERVAYRTQRLLDKIDEKPNPVAFVHLMAGHDRADLKRVLELMSDTG